MDFSNMLFVNDTAIIQDFQGANSTKSDRGMKSMVNNMLCQVNNIIQKDNGLIMHRKNENSARIFVQLNTLV